MDIYCELGNRDPIFTQAYFTAFFFSYNFISGRLKKEYGKHKKLGTNNKTKLQGVEETHEQCFKDLEFVGTKTLRFEFIFSCNCLHIL